MSGVFLLASTLLGLALAAAFGNGVIGYPAGERFYSFLSAICHQQPLRSYWLFDHPMGLCARCVGGYLGVCLGTLICYFHLERMSVKTRIVAVLIALALFAVGVIDGYLRVLDTNLWRSFTGMLGGAGFGATSFLLLYFLLSGILFLKDWGKS